MAKPRAILTNPWLLGGVIAAVALAAYIPAVSAGFFGDDYWLLHDNAMVSAPDGLYRFWCTTEAPDYFPLTWSTLWAEWRLWGDEAAGYHVTNIVLHAISAVLVWRLLLCLRVPGAWLAAAVFAVHPVNVESVAWISQRKNVLAMVFCLPAALAYFRSQRGAHKGWYAAALVFFALALLSKAAVVMLPLALLVLTWYRRGRLGWRDLAVSAPMLAMSLVLGLVTVVFQRNLIAGGTVRPEGFASRLAAAGAAVWFYLYKAVLPVRLALIYPRWQVDARAPLWYVPLALLIACFAGLWLARRWRWARPVLAALACYAIMMFPMLGFFENTYWSYSLVADRYQYFSLAAAVAMVVAGAVKLLGPGAAARRRVGAAVGVAVVCTLAALTWHRAGLFGNREALWRDTLAKNPDGWVPRSKLAGILMGRGSIDEVISLWRGALARGAHEHRALNELAWVYATWPDEKVRDGPEALRLIERARGLAGQDSALLLDTLAAALAEVGRFEEAVVVATEALRLAEAAMTPQAVDEDRELLRQCRTHLELYKARRPCRQGGPKAPGADTPMKE